MPPQTFVRGKEREGTQRDDGSAVHQRMHHALMPIADRAEPLDVLGARVDDALRELDIVDGRDERRQIRRGHDIDRVRPIDCLHLLRQRMRRPRDRIDIEDGRHRREVYIGITTETQRTQRTQNPLCPLCLCG